ncbi:MAG TPA: EscC/YscC/HrcC family type III secretion system outer membrane ring protein, partial [Ramlibacter sp.]|nr:EscC/YscC/HrcC family type III secretion system outer membrane ring protein [Ramlibacter sp.]
MSMPLFRSSLAAPACGWRHRLRPWLAALLIAGAGPAALASPVPWPDAPYSYFANNARLDAVLADFAASFSLSLSLPQDIGAAMVNGRFTTKNPSEFIGKLAGVYGFVWYTHAGTLFVSRATDVTTRGISSGAGSITGMRKALTDLGVLEPRFGWGELSEQNVALVSGPPSYVSLVEATVRNLPAARSQQVAVFRLKHASAEDRTILFRDREITTPGLTTILRELVTGRGGGAGLSESVVAAAAPLRTAN